MKIILINVTSLDGRFTKWNGKSIYEWSSKEDFEFFKKTKFANNLLVMGSATFEPVVKIPKAGLKPEKERLRVILTKNPSKYKKYKVPGQMEFKSLRPNELIKHLEKRGFKQMLLISGGGVANSFIKEGLVDELWLTLEPWIFGSGKSLAEGSDLDVKLRLMSSKKLNPQGTLLLKYKVL